MEPSSKLADLTLVAKYHPVANYSYPRNETWTPASAVSSSSTGCYSDRSSLASQASSTPGLIDDRTDSEVSVDDDYQYHAHTTELWDSFWHQPAKVMDHMHPRKRYPALIPSPRANRRRRNSDATHAPAAWPLPEPSPRDRSRKPAATYTVSPKMKSPTYSAFPKPPPTQSRASTSPAPAVPRRRPSSPKPSRPHRPPGEIITPCIRVVTPCARQPDMSPASSPYQHAMMTYRFPPASPTMNLPSPSPTTNWSPGAPRDSGFLDGHYSRPRTAAGHGYSSSAASSVSANVALEQAYQYYKPARDPRHCKSIANLANPVPEPEPHSVFEYDSDSDSEHGRSFFRFHRRNDSDGRRSTKTAAPEAPPSQARRRTRPQTAPSEPEPQHQVAGQACKQEPPPRRKRQGHDVFGRMLGRRSR